jgi:RHS repeat-associated protein
LETHDLDGINLPLEFASSQSPYAFDSLFKSAVYRLAAPVYQENPTNTPTPTATPEIYTYSRQPDGTSGVDTYILSSSPTTNNGTAVAMWVGEGNNATNRVARSLIKFDLSFIPANANIISATLSLWPSDDFSDNDRTIRVYRLKVPFNELDATWNERQTGVSWDEAGASGADDHESTEIGSFQMLADETLDVEKQIALSAAQIQEMINGTFTNNGFVIIADTELNDRFNYRSSDAVATTKRPKLIIQYTVPPATDTPTPAATPTNTPDSTATSTATETATSTPVGTSTFTPTPTGTPIPSGPVIIDYVYDPLNRLTEANYSTSDYYHYTYDAVGNRLSETTHLSITNYVYDDADRIDTVNGISYDFDNNGNLRNDGVNTYGYDSANRLISFSNGQGTDATYAYNGLGDRIQETVNGQTATFLMDLNTGLTQALSDGTNNYIYGVDRIAQTQGSATEYFLGDILGSVRQMTDANAQITYTRAYDPYGVVTSTNGSSQSAYGYTNEYTSQGLTYLRARYYSSETGRFLTQDTWGGNANSPLSLNKWNYVSGNPINRIDPTGHCEQTGDDLCWAAYAEILRWRPDLADASILSAGGVYISLHEASYGQLKFILDNQLWGFCLVIPETEADNYAFYSSCDAIAWVDQHRNEIRGAAQRHGLPPELVAGILASELDFDYELTDMLGDLAFQVGGNNYVAWYLEKVSSDPGPGVASMHLSTWEIVQQYYLDCGYDLGTILAPGGQTLSQIQWIMTVLTPTGSIESASALTRLLADYRTGSNSQPKKTTHYNDLTFMDMSQIFGAYRAGIGGSTCFRDDNKDGTYDCGFQDVRFFQDMDNLGPQAQQAYPYFGFFQRYFEYYLQQDK